ncbi:MAG TPA: SDR family NAD(P)-dependent oxidoreductase [Chitinophagales bacterium]
MKILLTGANGSLGSQIAKKLLANGHAVRAIKRATSDLKLLGNDAEKIEWFEGDVRDIFSLENAMQDITHLVHCAALISFLPEDENVLMQINVEGTANVMNAALEANLQKVLHVSSVAAFGRPKGVSIIDETLDTKDSKDNFNYYRSKLLGEREAWRANAEGLNVVIINPSTILGDGNWDKEPNIAFDYAYKNYPFYTQGANGFVDVRDVAEIAIQLLLSDVNNEQFIVSAENMALREFQNLLADEFGKKRPTISIGKWLTALAWRGEWVVQKISGKRPLLTKETAQLTQSTFAYSNEKIKTALNYSFIPVRESVCDYCKVYLSNRYALS